MDILINIGNKNIIDNSHNICLIDHSLRNQYNSGKVSYFWEGSLLMKLVKTSLALSTCSLKDWYLLNSSDSLNCFSLSKFTFSMTSSSPFLKEVNSRSRMELWKSPFILCKCSYPLGMMCLSAMRSRVACSISTVYLQLPCTTFVREWISSLEQILSCSKMACSFSMKEYIQVNTSFTQRPLCLAYTFHYALYPFPQNRIGLVYYSSPCTIFQRLSPLVILQVTSLIY